MTEDTIRPHAVYRLGPPLPMNGPIPAGDKGTNFRASRAWVLVDQLLTAQNLKTAIASSKAITGGASAEAEED